MKNQDHHHHHYHHHHHQQQQQHQQLECVGCGGGGSPQRWRFMHSVVRHRGSYQRLCTDCLLKNHQGLFCPVCLHVFDDSRPPPPHDRLICLKCPAITHRSCASVKDSVSFTCPPCSNPNFTFFNNGKAVVDKGSAKALVAAAKISAASMARAAAAARIEMEKKVKEAALARKRAKEALERVAFLAARERDSSKIPAVETNGKAVLVKAKT